MLGWRLRGEPGVAAYAVRVIAVFNRVKASELVGCMGVWGGKDRWSWWGRRGPRGKREGGGVVSDG